MLEINCFPRWSRGLGLALLSSALGGCVTLEKLVEVPVKSESTVVEAYNTALHRRSIDIFDPLTLDRRVAELRLEPRVEHLFFLLDQSPAVSDRFQGQESRLHAHEMVRRFARTMPDRSYSGAFLVFDQGSDQGRRGEPHLTVFTGGEIEQVLNTPGAIKRIEAVSLASALDRLTPLLSRSQGRSAVVLVTSWAQIDKAVEQAVLRMRQRTRLPVGAQGTGQGMANRQTGRSGVCFYTLGVGNRLSRTRLETVDSCGFSVAADKVAQPSDMAHFVQSVLYKGPADSDGDGIYDYRDQCPGTPTGRIVDYSGCLRFAGIQRGISK
jgi:hypothetical protein